MTNRQQLIEHIHRLPQAAHLPGDRINAWLDAVLAFDGPRALWHIRRLSGLGGSEIGAVVAPWVGEFDPFKTDREVAMDKLMLSVPVEPNGHMKRGIAMEDTIRDAFRKDFQVKPIDDLMKAMNEHRSSKHAWMVGNPDDVVVIGNKNYIVDYKCPMPGFADKYDAYGLPFGYIAQLHHYRNLAIELGGQIDGLLLCNWDMIKWECDVRPVEINPQLASTLIEAGDTLWNDYVLKGLLPVKEISTPKVAVDDRFKHADLLKMKLDELAVYTVLANEGSKRAKEIKEELSLGFEGHSLVGEKVVHGAMEVSAKAKLVPELVEDAVWHHPALQAKLADFAVTKGFDQTVMKDLLDKAGVPEMAYTIRETDWELVAQELEKLGVPLSRLSEESYTFSVSKVKSGAAADLVSRLKGETEQVYQHLMSTMTVDDQPQPPRLKVA